MILFIRRWKEIPRRPAKHSYYSREFALFLGSSTLVLIAIFVVVGTSSPIITEVLYGKKSAVDISYYATTILPLAVILTLLMGVGQLLWWTRSDRSVLLRSAIDPARPCGADPSGPVLSRGQRGHPVPLPLRCRLRARSEPDGRLDHREGESEDGRWRCRAHRHGVMFFGFVASSKFSNVQTVSLPLGTPVHTLGYTLTYTGQRPIEGGKFVFDVRVEKDGHVITLSPVMYNSEYTQSVMRNPDIANLKDRDFYLAPLGLEETEAAQAGGAKTEMLVAEASVKPLINLVWAGADHPACRRGCDDRATGRGRCRDARDPGRCVTAGERR